MMEQLKPCPFCGEKLKEDWNDKDHYLFLTHKTVLGDCPLRLGVIITAYDKKQIVERWNRRADNGKEDI